MEVYKYPCYYLPQPGFSRCVDRGFRMAVLVLGRDFIYWFVTVKHENGKSRTVPAIPRPSLRVSYLGDGE